ncbi:MAG: NAD-dependent epimerase/dehydratase family protein [Clostridia bacterium]|nr:NAD-dependent epimerase/dehydratase family protein [Clostridia bacterium]
MKRVLITGGTVFVSRYAAQYFVNKGWAVYVLNRNTKQQVDGVTLIQADRHDLGDRLQGMRFDAVLDITAYDAQDVHDLLDALDGFGAYLLISSSAVYPEWAEQPFTENTPVGENAIWGKYGTDKIEAERALLSRAANAYVIRPPYLYGPMNNVYREAFVFDCALANRRFCLPKDGSLPLQFFHVEDLCRFMEILLEKKPAQRVFNVGNPETVTARQWAECCYRAAGKRAEFVCVDADIDQRNYFSFYDYAYVLDVAAQQSLMPDVMQLEAGLGEAFAWYLDNQSDVRKKPLIEYIDRWLDVES